MAETTRPTTAADLARAVVRHPREVAALLAAATDYTRVFEERPRRSIAAAAMALGLAAIRYGRALGAPRDAPVPLAPTEGD